MLVRRLLFGLRAALRGGPDGHDPAHATLLQSLLGAVVGSGGIRTAIILVGLACHIVQLVVSIRNREKLRDVTDDP
jgi:hypothetical protein